MSTVLESFVPATSAQIFVFKYCEDVASYFINNFHLDWLSGLFQLSRQLRNTEHFEEVTFSNPSMLSHLLDEGNGYVASTYFYMNKPKDEKICIKLILAARFHEGQCNLHCTFEMENTFAEVFNISVSFSNSKDRVALSKRLMNEYSPRIFEEANRRMGLTGDLPQLRSCGITT